MNIQHDFHIHTNLSVCAKPEATFEMYQGVACEQGLKKLGFADHLWDDIYEQVCGGFYKRQNVPHVLQLREKLHDFDGVQVYLGCEAEYNPKTHGVALSEEAAEQFDFVIVPTSHTHMVMPKDLYEPYEKHKNFMIQAYTDVLNCNIAKYIKAMAHPFAAVCCPYGNRVLMEMMTDDEYRRVFDLTAEKGVAVEINLSGYPKNDHEKIIQHPSMRMFRIAKECGCQFVFGSDSHGIGGHNAYRSCAEFVASVLELSENDIADFAK